MNGGKPWFRRIFPRKLFTWREPVDFRQVASEFTPRLEMAWNKPFIASTLFLILISHWLGRKWFGPDGEPLMSLPLALAISIFGSVAFAYLFPWLTSKLPVYVNLFENQLSKAQGDLVSNYKFKDMTHYDIQLRDGFWVLSLQLNSGTRVTMGVPNNIRPEDVAAFLSKAGLKRGTDLVPINKPVPEMS